MAEIPKRVMRGILEDSIRFHIQRIRASLAHLGRLGTPIDIVDSLNRVLTDFEKRLSEALYP